LYLLGEGIHLVFVDMDGFAELGGGKLSMD
jgi:hypothetical protein